MSELKWIKLNLDMFDNRKIKQIRKMPGGNDMVLFWVMLLTLAGKSNSQGYILFTENIPYTPEMLANECDIELNTIKMALQVFEKFNMINLNEETIVISSWADHQSVDGLEKIKEQNRLRKQKQRNKAKEIQAPATDEVTVTDNKSRGMSRDMSREVSHTMSRDPSNREREERIENKEIRKENKEKEREKEEDKETLSVTEKTFEILDFYEQKTSVTITGQYELVKNLVEIYDIADIKEALLKSIERGKKGKGALDYTKGILQNWAVEGKEKYKGGKNNGNNRQSAESEDIEGVGIEL